MNTCQKLILTALLMMPVLAFAQQAEEAKALVKEGIALNNQGKYAEAIEKYQGALKLEPGNAQANYQIGFTLLAEKKNSEAIPFLENAIKGNGSANLTASCYELLGSIYDQDHQTQKAIDAYKEGIKVAPDMQRLHFNLGITYSRNKQYAEAENEAIEAIKLDPKHASSQRMYALVTFHQNKRVNALLGFCSFIMLEPNTPRSAEAYTNIQSILKGGVLKDATTGSTDGASNAIIQSAVSSAKSKAMPPMDALEYELKAIFTKAGELSQQKTDKDFFEKFYAQYFYKLAQTDNMAAFTRLVCLSANKDENTKWMADHDQLVKDLNKWIADTPRSF
jgi:tetratricopeptide (TPR) repeat protein